MQKELISMRQAFCTIVLFICGSSVVMGGNSDAGQDSWISLLLAFLGVIPMFIFYARIIRLYPDKNIFEIFEALFGKIFSKFFIAMMSWYALHLCALVVVYFSQFIEIMDLPETPQLPLMIIMLAATSFLAASGVETLGKWSIIALPIVCVIVALTIIMSLNQMNFSNILPVMENDFSTIASGSLKLFSFPLAESVLFLGLAGSFKKQTNPYKLFVYAAAFAVLLMIIVMLRNIELLGPALMKTEYFPSYIAARIINVGEFLTRIEGSISMNFIISGITKITVCLLVAAKGTAHLFGIPNYRKILIPVALLTLSLSAILFSSAMEMFAFIDIYKYYAPLFQVVIPISVWLFAEIKIRRQKKLAAGGS